MALNKGKVKTKQETITEEVEAQTTEVEKTEDSMPFTAGTPEPEVNTKVVPIEPATDKSVVSTVASTAIDTPAASSGNSSLAAFAEAGFEDLDLGFGAFPIISLKNDGKFEDNEGNVYDEEFLGIVEGTVKKYIMGNTKCEKKEEVVFYSYDKINATNGQSLAEIREGWAEQGWGFDLKHYTEARISIVDEEGEIGNMALLSIPPNSRTRFSGFQMQNFRRHQLMPNQYVTRFEVGNKIQGDYEYFPWKFSFVQAV